MITLLSVDDFSVTLISSSRENGECAYIILCVLLFSRRIFPKSERLHNFSLKREKDARRKRAHDVWRGGNRADDDKSERFFVGRDREVRRCVFHAHSSEIEWNGTYLVRSNKETRADERSPRADDVKNAFKVARCRRYRLWQRGRIDGCGRVSGIRTIFLLASCLHE